MQYTQYSIQNSYTGGPPLRSEELGRNLKSLLLTERQRLISKRTNGPPTLLQIQIVVCKLI